MHDAANLCLSAGAVMAGLASMVFVAIHQSPKNILSREEQADMLLDRTNITFTSRFKPQYNPFPQRKLYSLDVVDRMAEYDKDFLGNNSCEGRNKNYKPTHNDEMNAKCDIFRNVSLFAGKEPFGPDIRRSFGSRLELRKLQRECHLRELMRTIERRRSSRQSQLARRMRRLVSRKQAKSQPDEGRCYTFACPPMCHLLIQNMTHFHSSVNLTIDYCFSCYFDCRMVRNLFVTHPDWHQQCRCGKVMSIHGSRMPKELLIPERFTWKYTEAINMKHGPKSGMNRDAPTFHANMNNYKCFSCQRRFCNVMKNPRFNSRDLRSGPNHPARAPRDPPGGAAGGVLAALAAAALAPRN